jgi:hypothetical protein
MDVRGVRSNNTTVNYTRSVSDSEHFAGNGSWSPMVDHSSEYNRRGLFVCKDVGPGEAREFEQ